MIRLQSLLGLVFLTALAWILSENRKQINYRTVVTGIALQFGLCLLLLKLPACRDVFLLLNKAVMALDFATTEGTKTVFGFLGGGALPYDEKFPGASFVFACRGLPIVLVISAITSLLFYWRVLPTVVRLMSWVFRRTMGIGGCEALGSAANVFVGMVEAPLFIRPYLSDFSRGEIFTVMVTGMATIAGTVMVLYAMILGNAIPDALGHILVASIISAPAAIVVSKLMIPQVGEPVSGMIVHEEEYAGAMDAIVQGTSRGVQLLINIVAMLIVCIALVHLVNLILGGVLPEIGEKPVTLQRLLGIILAPVAWLLGIPWAEARTVGSLIGIKTILNEFLAYIELSGIPAGELSERSRIIVTYALCGFANFGSLGIMIGGLGAMCPEQRPEIIKLGFRSILAGTIATCMTGAMVGIVL
ncbi:NupC/NupG family nucleoside CNT transporter [Candidatus Hydrogenedentota bacterium]